MMDSSTERSKRTRVREKDEDRKGEEEKREKRRRQEGENTKEEEERTKEEEVSKGISWLGVVYRYNFVYDFGFWLNLALV
jgi:hypothetical protein